MATAWATPGCAAGHWAPGAPGMGNSCEFSWVVNGIGMLNGCWMISGWDLVDVEFWILIIIDFLWMLNGIYIVETDRMGQWKCFFRILVGSNLLGCSWWLNGDLMRQGWGIHVNFHGWWMGLEWLNGCWMISGWDLVDVEFWILIIIDFLWMLNGIYIVETDRMGQWKCLFRILVGSNLLGCSWWLNGDLMRQGWGIHVNFHGWWMGLECWMDVEWLVDGI